MSKQKEFKDMSLPEVETDGPALKTLIDAQINGPPPEAQSALDEVLKDVELEID